MMVRRIFRADDGAIFETEAEAVQHERHVQGLGKLKALLLEAPVTRIAMIEQKLVNEEFIGKLGAWMLSISARTPVGNILRMIDYDVSQFNRRPVGKENRGDQRASGAASGAAPTSMAGIAAQGLRAAEK